MSGIDLHELAAQEIADLRAKLQAAERERDEAKSLVRLELDNLAKVGAVADKLRDERDALAANALQWKEWLANLRMDVADGFIATSVVIAQLQAAINGLLREPTAAILAEHDREVARRCYEIAKSHTTYSWEVALQIDREFGVTEKS